MEDFLSVILMIKKNEKSPKLNSGLYLSVYECVQCCKGMEFEVAIRIEFGFVAIS